MKPNLFNALFDWRPRAAIRPDENFLTEAFVYILRTDPAVLTRFLSRIGMDTNDLGSVKISTRSAYKLSSGQTVYPDLEIVGRRNGQRCTTLSEHKWGSRFDDDQMRKYATLLPGADDRLLFVGVNRQSLQQARASVIDPQLAGKFQPLRWEDLFLIVKSAPPTPIAAEFLEFMERKGLGPMSAIDGSVMRGFMMSQGFLSQLLAYANRVADDFNVAQHFPAVYSTASSADSGWGRVAVTYAGPRYHLAFGFLYNAQEQGIDLVEPSSGVDLFLRLTVPDDAADVDPMLFAALQSKAQTLTDRGSKMLVRGQAGLRNSRVLAIVQKPIARLLTSADTDQQLAAMSDQLATWAKHWFGGSPLPIA